MALLIDGYNLLNVTGIFGGAGPGTELHRTRLAFLNFLARSFSRRKRSETTIVFDAAGAPPGLPHSISHEGMSIFFARQFASADEMIEQLLEDWPAPRALVVVSSDHRVQRAARRRGASYVDSEQWYRALLAELRNRPREVEPGAAKPAVEMPPEELAHWLKAFADAPIDDSEQSFPFPPGYGSDAGQDETEITND
ncbi:MAG: NYN domain-containing protein [Pirellulales bacterium]|nr:NYN domain-containing protein [Pirellulales bacterium]